MTKIWTAIGLMSGTSMDGIDVALVRSDGHAYVDRGPSMFFEYAPDTRDLLAGALETAKSIKARMDRPGNLGDVEKAITHLHIDAVRRFLAKQNLPASEVDLIGFHGQTVLHRPETALTVQLGDGETLAKQSGISTVYDFRANDMANAGQGAPLVPIYHQALSATLDEEYLDKTPIAFVNIGGISNITYVNQDELIAFDTGPGNALIDQWVQNLAGIPYDQGAMIAAEGGVDMAMVETYLADPYFDKAIPKSLDRNDFKLPSPEEISLEDGAKTLAHVTAASILKSCDHLPQTPKLWVICGGGRHNPSIMADLKELAERDSSEVISAEAAGLDGDAMEAEAFGYLAIRSKLALPLTFPTTTGCKKPVTGGELVGA